MRMRQRLQTPSRIGITQGWDGLLLRLLRKCSYFFNSSGCVGLRFAFPFDHCNLFSQVSEHLGWLMTLAVRFGLAHACRWLATLAWASSI